MESQQGNKFTNLKVIGVGGGGGNVIKRMLVKQMPGVELLAANTDVQDLKSIPAEKATRIQIGSKLTKGLGAGAKPEVGRKSAEEDRDQLFAALQGSDMVFITAGMGGGTGTGAAPVIARISKELGILTVAVVTKPFSFEGPRKMAIAEEGIVRLREYVDSLIVIPNSNLSEISDMSLSLLDSFKFADDVVKSAIQGMIDVIHCPGESNVDFNDVKTIMKNKGKAVMSMGYGQGENKAVTAVKSAINSRILEDKSIANAKGVVVNIIAPYDIGLFEINDAMSIIHKEVDPNALIVWGQAFDENMKDEVKVTVIATGLDSEKSTPKPINDLQNPRPVVPSAAPSQKSSFSNMGDPNRPAFDRQQKLQV